jgi:RNA polymerase sigma-70 factor (ECF subfamily)
VRHQLTPEQEQQLIAQAQGSADGVRELYRHYLPSVYAYVAYRVGQAQDAEDLVSETFLRTIEHLDTFQWRGVHSFRAWLFRIAHNVVQDTQRRNGKHLATLPLDDLPTLQASALLPDDLVLQREQFAHLRQLIGTLSPRRQEIITLKFFGGLRNQEIAAILQLDERTVAAHLCRGLEDLHRKFTEEDAHEHVERTK